MRSAVDTTLKQPRPAFHFLNSSVQTSKTPHPNPFPFFSFTRPQLLKNVQRKRKADGGFSVYKNQAAKPPAQPSRTQNEEQQKPGAKEAETGRRTLREGASQEARKKLARETLDRLKRCKIAEPVVTVHDVNDKDDPCACAEYVVDMYKHFKELEVRRLEMRVERIDFLLCFCPFRKQCCGVCFVRPCEQHENC